LGRRRQPPVDDTEELVLDHTEVVLANCHLRERLL
jgi:hypothetical protein